MVFISKLLTGEFLMKILFINPIIRQQDAPRFPPYGMAQLVALVLKEGYKLQVFDANAWRPSKEVLKKILLADEWDVILTGGLITTYNYIKSLVKVIKALKPNSKIVLGGGIITPIPYEIMTFLPEVDIGVIGEGYSTVLEILDALKEDSDNSLSYIKGIIFRDKTGELILTDHRELIQEDGLDNLPFPAFNLFPMDIYFKNSGILLSEAMMTSKAHIGLIASYGCPFKCKYCFHLGLSGELLINFNESCNKKEVIVTTNRYIRKHSPEYVIEMVAYFRKMFNIDFISFLDENFALLYRNSKWFGSFYDLWMMKGFQPLCRANNISHDTKCSGIHWGTTCHAKLAEKEMLKTFYKMGCSHLDYGLESFDDDILKEINKKSTAEINVKAIKLTLEAGIRPIPNQIIGFPSESFKSIKTNIFYWKKLGIRSKPFLATPYPGSEWYFTYKNKILEQYDNNLESFLMSLGDAMDLTVVLSKNFNAVELLGIRELMVNYDIKRIEEYELYKKQQIC